MCRQDTLYWINSFCWLYEPRARANVIPFITWPHQEPLIEGIQECLDVSLDNPEDKLDFGVEKSRGEGATWICLMVALHRWLFTNMFACGLVSMNEDAVDSKNPDSLMRKIDWQIEQQPWWMLPPGFSFRTCRNHTQHSLANPHNGSTIVGFAATGNVGSGGRKTWFFLDELGRFKKNEDWLAISTTQHITDCRGMVGSYRGETGAWYKIMKLETSLKKYRLPWWDNPTRNRLLYRETDGGTAPVRESDLASLRLYESRNEELLTRLAARGFFGKPGRYHSPWYDLECDRAPSSYHVAEELDMDPSGVKPKIFDLSMLYRLRNTVMLPPTKRGELRFCPMTLKPERFIEGSGGRLRLWCAIGADGRPPAGKYCLGLDLALGSAGDSSSNSAIVGIDAISGSQVLEFVTNQLDGGKMAEYTTALATWFWDAEVNFEWNGPGGVQFYNRIVGDKLYPHLYYSRDLLTNKRAPKPGMYHNKADVKYGFLKDLADAMSLGDFLPRSEILVRECEQFEVVAEGNSSKVVHVGERSSMDEGGKGEAHGDVVIAAAMMWMSASGLLKRWQDAHPDKPKMEREVPPEEIHENSFAGRRLAREGRARREESWLDFRVVG
jgi:hypothetical protein